MSKEDRAGRTTTALLGCDKATFYYHIEAQFVGEMSWIRMGEIEIDHRTPLSYPGVSGGPPTPEEKVVRLHYLNCSPLWQLDNRVKHNHYAEDPLPAPAEPPKTPQLSDDEVTDLLAEFGF